MLKLVLGKGAVLVAELAHDLAVHHHPLFKAAGEEGRAGRGRRDVCKGEIKLKGRGCDAVWIGRQRCVHFAEWGKGTLDHGEGKGQTG